MPPPPVDSLAEPRTRGDSASIAGDTEGKRVRSSAGQRTEPAVLRNLARDPSVTVRAALAMNPAAPVDVNNALACDRDGKVRLLLASKLAALVPGLSQANQAMLYEQTWGTLAILVEDEVTRIRAIIAEAAKDLADAPREVVLCLAHDVDVSVYEPVIRLSPLLTSDDLISLITEAPGHQAVTAVANRADLAASVADAIAVSADAGAIGALLANPTAHIREATLDALVVRSVEHPEWHEPLVRRPSLPLRTARVLSGIVATHLLAVLAARADLPQSFEELRVRVAAQLAERQDRRPTDGEMTTDEALGRAHASAASGELGEDTLMGAACRGEARYAAALLATAAGVPIAVVDRAALLRSAKGMVSLVWKAGFTMRAAVAMQYLLARLPPSEVLVSGPADSFPLAVEEMRWQLDFLGRTGR